VIVAATLTEAQICVEPPHLGIRDQHALLHGSEALDERAVHERPHRATRARAQPLLLLLLLLLLLGLMLLVLARVQRRLQQRDLQQLAAGVGAAKEQQACGGRGDTRPGAGCGIPAAAR